MPEVETVWEVANAKAMLCEVADAKAMPCEGPMPRPKRPCARRKWGLLCKVAAAKSELPESEYLWADREEAWAAKCGQV